MKDKQNIEEQNIDYSNPEMLLENDIVEQKFGSVNFYRYKIVEKIQKNGNESVTDEKGKPLNGHCNIADTRGNYIDVYFKEGKKHGEEIKYNYDGRKLSMKSFENGKKSGKSESYFNDDSIRVKGSYLDGFQNGKWEYFDESGELKSYETYKKGRKDGEWWERKEYNGYYIVTGEYENDIPVGVWTEKWEEGGEKERITYTGKGTYTKNIYYDTGELQMQESYKNFKLEGEQLSYTNSNVLIEKATYLNGLLVKEELFYKTGRPCSMYTKENGKLHGKFFRYKSSGVKELEGEYEKGNRTGLWKSYIGDEGRLAFETNYKNDVEDGLKKVYDRKEKLEYEGNNINDERDGLWKWYYNDGNIKEEVHYNLGTKTSSIRKSYHDNGILKELENYKASKRHGEQFTYSEAKVLIQKLTYEDNELIKDESFFESGRPHQSYTKKNDKFDGEFISFNDFGEKEEEGNYLNGNKTGLWKIYSDKEGWLKEEITFKDNLKNGLNSSYYYSGNIEYKGTFLNGEKNGIWEYYNERGKIIKEFEYDRGNEISSKTFN